MNNKSECVERDTAVKRLHSIRAKYECLNLSDTRCYSAINECIQAIESAPEAKTIADGIWRYQKLTVPRGGGQTYYRWSCSACKNKFLERSNFCPNCGAKMTTEPRCK